MTTRHFSTPLAATLVTAFGLLGAACTSTGDDVADGSKRECRTFATTGSNLKESICRTQEQWAAIDAGEAERAGREALVDDFFRRQGELGAQGQGQAFDTP